MSEQIEPLFDSREHELLVGLLINMRATRERWIRGDLPALDALSEAMGNLRAYDEAMADGD